MAHTPSPYKIGDPIRNKEGEVIGAITGVSSVDGGGQSVRWSIQVEFLPGIIQQQADVLGISIDGEDWPPPHKPEPDAFQTVTEELND